MTDDLEVRGPHEVEIDHEIEDAIDLDALAFQVIGAAIVEAVGEPDSLGDLPVPVRLRGTIEVVPVDE